MDDYELTYTQEQKIRRFVARYKFTNAESIERAVVDCEVHIDGSISSKNNDDVEAFPDAVDGQGVRRFVAKLIGRQCACAQHNTDAELCFYFNAVTDDLFGKFEVMTGKIARERHAPQLAATV
jgi:hypothetical protein